MISSYTKFVTASCEIAILLLTILADFLCALFVLCGSNALIFCLLLSTIYCCLLSTALSSIHCPILPTALNNLLAFLLVLLFLCGSNTLFFYLLLFTIYYLLLFTIYCSVYYSLPHFTNCAQQSISFSPCSPLPLWFKRSFLLSFAIYYSLPIIHCPFYPQPLLTQCF